MQLFSSDNPNEAAVAASNTAKGPAVWADTTESRAVVGVGHGESCAIWGEVDSGRAIVGAAHGEGTGLWGDVNTGRAIVGVVRGGAGAGVWGETTNGTGVVGKDNGGGDGVVGEGRRGVVGRSPDYQGVYGWSRENAGVVGESETMHGVFGVSRGPGFAGVFGTAVDPAGLAAAFDGNVEIGRRGQLTLKGGDLILANADCAEDFDLAEACEPGTVMVLTDEGAVQASETAYDRRVAGVISGAGGYRRASCWTARNRGRAVAPSPWSARCTAKPMRPPIPSRSATCSPPRPSQVTPWQLSTPGEHSAPSSASHSVRWSLAWASFPSW